MCPAENATYISELDKSNPSGDSLRSESDDHHRLVKDVLQNQFVGNANDPYDKPVTVGPNALNALGAVAGSDYVTLGTTQTVTGRKDFTQVVELGGGATMGGNYLVGEFNGEVVLGNVQEDAVVATKTVDGFRHVSVDGIYAPVLHTQNMARLLVNTLYPVGSVYINLTDYNPSNQFPGTSWGNYRTSPDGQFIQYFWRRTA